MPNVPLFYAPAVVAVARPPSHEPSIVVGPADIEPLGRCVAIGASASVNGIALAFLGHVSPDMARDIAGRLIAAADEVDAAGGGDPIARGTEAAAKTGGLTDGPAFILPGNLTMSEKGPDSPPISEGVAQGDDEFLMSKPEFLGIQAQVQHPTQSGKPPSHAPGAIGATMMTGPGGVACVVVGMTHADGTSLAAILSLREYISFGECYDEAGKILGPMAGRA